MVEVSIRIFFQKNDAGLYPDYHPQLDMIEEKHLPSLLRQAFFHYLKMYLNFMDYIVVADESVKEALIREGVSRPQYLKIPSEKKIDKTANAFLWLKLYQKMAAE
ncbi:MAG TPA: hypothetical protein IAA06_10320 [Candidatus Blautia faecavium]|uniref:Uncharacterized protein n=1 Tax=Candidatus Blautia faecavium TaxID=2838487 RepID=A0A9D2LUB5_9FIRM|nr:hypothetical protein [Candidatus Blautia faecavium]